jgi:hypothetical protein
VGKILRIDLSSKKSWKEELDAATRKNMAASTQAIGLFGAFQNLTRWESRCQKHCDPWARIIQFKI